MNSGTSKRGKFSLPGVVLLSISLSDHLARSVACRKVARSAGVTGTAREGRNEAF